MAPRASWKGYLKLSLVSCPVRLFTAATTGNRISFNMLHKDTHNRVQFRPHDPEIGEVDRADLVRGYEFEKDQYVIIDDEDLDAVQIESSKTITIDRFVDASDIDPMYLDAPYYLAPDGPVAEETYRVIHNAMNTRGKAALARVVMSARERQVVLSVRDRGVVMTTLRAANEVRAHEEYFSDIGDAPLDAGMIALAEQIIDQNGGEFDATTFEDAYQKALLEVVKAKLKGSRPVIAKSPERGKVINLMDALKRSLEEGTEKKPPARGKRRAASAATKAAKPRRARSA